MFDRKEPFTDSAIRDVPNESGVYELIDAFHVTIYIGCSGTSIRRRLLSHYRGFEGECTKDAFWFRYELTAFSVTREQDLLREYKQANGQYPRCNERSRANGNHGFRHSF